MHVHGVQEGAALEGTVGGRPLSFFPHGDAQAALVGFDIETKAGPVPWTLAVRVPGDEPRVHHGRVTVQRRDFPVQHLTLPTAMVDLDPETERRAVREGEELRTLYRTVSPERLWRGAFIHPLRAPVPGTNFGSRRVINGQPRAPHGGADYAAPMGTPVVAANAGRVAVVADHFFPGRLVALDHGLGLHTLYFHLDRTSVVEGERVERGQVIGSVGATGRATGPHLHFGVQVGSARVDPASLLELGIRD
jgi:murein DD-endopeptidase MepM/ murein hydrolase activator NlpD